MSNIHTTILDREITAHYHELTSFTQQKLRECCRALGVYPVSNNDLQTMLEKSFRQPVVYDGYPCLTLEHKLNDRGLEIGEKLTLPDKPPTKSPVPKKATHARSKLTARHKRQLALLRSRYKEAAIQALEAADRNTRFDFLGLPAELRLKIYRLTCSASGTIMYPTQPAITKVCRCIRAEALPVYYSSNCFGIMFWGNPWLAAISATNLARIRSFDFVRPGTASSSRILLGLQIDFPIRGQQLEIVGRRSTYQHPIPRFDDRKRYQWYKEIMNETLYGQVVYQIPRKDANAKFTSLVESVLEDFDYAHERWRSSSYLRHLDAQTLKLFAEEGKLGQGFSLSSVEIIGCILYHRFD